MECICIGLSLNDCISHIFDLANLLVVLYGIREVSKRLTEKSIDAVPGFYNIFLAHLEMLKTAIGTLFDNSTLFIFLSNTAKNDQTIEPTSERITHFKTMVQDFLNFLCTSENQFPPNAVWFDNKTKLIKHLIIFTQDGTIYSNNAEGQNSLNEINELISSLQQLTNEKIACTMKKYYGCEWEKDYKQTLPVQSQEQDRNNK